MSCALIRGYNNRYPLADLWGQAFGDTPEFISDMYDCGYLNPDDIFALTVDGRLVAALLLPEYRICVNGEDLPIRLLSCVATDPSQQGKGYMSLLISRTLELVRQECCGVCVIPVSESLYSFYEKFGFTTAFYVSEKLFDPEIQPLAKVHLQESASISNLYGEYLKKYRSDGCVFKTEARFSQAIREYTHPTQPCNFISSGNGFAFYQRSTSEVLVREWAGMDEGAVASVLYEQYGLPVRIQNLPGTGEKKPIAMLCSFSDVLTALAQTSDLYLNCMYN